MEIFCFVCLARPSRLDSSSDSHLAQVSEALIKCQARVLGYGSAAPILQDRQCYFDNFHIQKLRSAAITASGALIQSGIV
jgi:hypothetical protein